MKWEYNVVAVEHNGVSDFTDFLNSFGEDGWQLVSFQLVPEATPSLMFIFKFYL